MRKMKLTLAYDGTPYHGWQVQPGLPTVQGELEDALGRLLDQRVRTRGAGRTDAGVHAHGQVAHFETGRPIGVDALHRGVNALLPPPIRVVGVEEAAAGFDARASARGKTYEYHIWRDPVVSPFRRDFVHALSRSLDGGAMDRATAKFVGVHDFTAFSAARAQVVGRVREVYDAGWERRGPDWVFRIRANGFLQYMARTIVGTLIEVGDGRIDPEDIDPIFDSRDRRRAGSSAPARGLHLMSVEYD